MRKRLPPHAQRAHTPATVVVPLTRAAEAHPTAGQATAPTTYVNVYMSKETKKRLRVRAATDDTTMTIWARDAIIAALDAADVRDAAWRE